MAEKPLTAVVCRNYQQFRAWCHDNARNPRDPSLCIVTEIHHARGREFDTVVLIDGPASLMAVAESRIRRSRSPKSLRGPAMNTRAKFRCAYVKHFAGDMRIVTMSAITDSDTPENQRFTTFTPSGTLEMHVDNPDVVFEPGKDYYLDFTLAD